MTLNCDKNHTQTGLPDIWKANHTTEVCSILITKTYEFCPRNKKSR